MLLCYKNSYSNPSFEEKKFHPESIYPFDRIRKILKEQIETLDFNLHKLAFSIGSSPMIRYLVNLSQWDGSHCFLQLQSYINDLSQFKKNTLLNPGQLNKIIKLEQIFEQSMQTLFMLSENHFPGLAKFKNRLTTEKYIQQILKIIENGQPAILPFSYRDKKDASGHTILFEITKTDNYFNISIFNTGNGINHHLVNKDNPESFYPLCFVKIPQNKIQILLESLFFENDLWHKDSLFVYSSIISLLGKPLENEDAYQLHGKKSYHEQTIMGSCGDKIFQVYINSFLKDPLLSSQHKDFKLKYYIKNVKKTLNHQVLKISTLIQVNKFENINLVTVLSPKKSFRFELIASHYAETYKTEDIKKLIHFSEVVSLLRRYKHQQEIINKESLKCALNKIPTLSGFLLRNIKSYPILFEVIPENLKQDQNLLIELLIDSSIDNIRFVPLGYLKDKEFMSALMLYFYNYTLKSNRTPSSNQILWQVLEYASNDLKNDPDLMLMGVRGSFLALSYASNELKNSPNFILSAVQISNDIECLSYASKKLQNDMDFISRAYQAVTLKTELK